MIILNLGCGNKTSSSPEVINIDSSFYLRLKQNKYLKFVAHPFLSEERRKKLDIPIVIDAWGTGEITVPPKVDSPFGISCQHLISGDCDWFDFFFSS